MDIQTVITEIIKSLAEWTGQTVETVTAYLPSFLIKYAWYDCIQDIFVFCGWLIPIGILAFVVFLAINVVSYDDSKNIFTTGINPIKITIIIISILFIGAIIYNISLTAVAPEIRAIDALTDLIKSSKN